MAIGNVRRWVMLAPVVAALGSGCSSSAPYTAQGAAINTALGLGASAQQRSAGGCFAECAHGTVCNPGTGLCERSPCGICPAGESCVAADDGWRCASREEVGKLTSGVRTQLPPPGQVVPGLGISPRTGSGPPEPHHPGPDQP